MKYLLICKHTNTAKVYATEKEADTASWRVHDLTCGDRKPAVVPVPVAASAVEALEALEQCYQRLKVIVAARGGIRGDEHRAMENAERALANSRGEGV